MDGFGLKPLCRRQGGFCVKGVIIILSAENPAKLPLFSYCSFFKTKSATKALWSLAPSAKILFTCLAEKWSLKKI